MFTGLIESMGSLDNIEYKNNFHRVLTISWPERAKELERGDSVCVNGVCQTVIDKAATSFTVETLEQSLRKTNLEFLKTGDFVNLERALQASSRYDGHMVQGHVQNTVQITQFYPKESNWYLAVRIDTKYLPEIIEEGSVCLDGISLTCAALKGDELICNIIPETLKSTTLQFRKIGDWLNLETDILGRYVKRYLSLNSDKYLAIHGGVK